MGAGLIFCMDYITDLSGDQSGT